jgi:hypothetical protein
MDFISKIVSLFGLTLGAPKIQAFLAEYPALKINKSSEGNQYVIGKLYGFEWLFEGERMSKTRF